MIHVSILVALAVLTGSVRFYQVPGGKKYRLAAIVLVRKPQAVLLVKQPAMEAGLPKPAKLDHRLTLKGRN